MSKTLCMTSCLPNIVYACVELARRLAAAGHRVSGAEIRVAGRSLAGGASDPAASPDEEGADA